MIKKNSGQKLLNKAKKIIPGGNQLLSKRSEFFLPQLWPNYYKSAKDCSVWDLDNNHYYDFAGMGVTSCILGYANNYVDREVISAIKNGSMSTLNSYEEFDLAKLLLDIHPWASMCKFTRSGGEACSVAVRIARAHSKKDVVAVCGYHGWHDWYISLNIPNKKNLDKLHLKGLQPLGVPKNLSGTTAPFYFNDKESFKLLWEKNKNNIGTIIMEPIRDSEPDLSFLRYIRSFSKKNSIVLIFDEITSGFHDNFGGIHLKYGIKPDMAIFGKAMGNGYPISAIIGTKKIMESAQETFISSTMWTERIGFTAAVATLQEMKKIDAQNKIIKKSKYISNRLNQIATKHDLNIEINGMESIKSLNFKYKNSEEIMTYFTQEMLKEGFLASSKIVLSVTHTKKIMDNYLLSANKVFMRISKYITTKRKFPLKGGIKHSSFQRLNK